MDMEISNAHNQQEMPATEQQQQHNQENKKPRPHPEQALPCPRCESTNTKFCYYNNYSLTQPRYFCKACRRYWTRGGSLRNVPVGGGCRKNHHKIKSKKPSSSSSTSTSSSNSSSSSSSSKQTLELDHLLTPNMNPTSLLPLSFDHHPPIDHMMSNFMLPYPNSNPNPLGFLDILRGSGGGLVDNSSMQSLCFGFGGHDQMFNTIDGGLLNSANSTTTTTTTTTNNTTAIAMDHGGGDSEVVDNVGGTHDQWGPLLGGDHGSLGGMDSSRDHYWNSNNNGWHGLINSSLM